MRIIRNQLKPLRVIEKNIENHNGNNQKFEWIGETTENIWKSLENEEIIENHFKRIGIEQQMKIIWKSMKQIEK